MTNDWQDEFHRRVDAGAIPGGVSLVSRGGDVEVRTAGTLALDGEAPMTRETIFRIASITKPIVTAAAMMLIDDGAISPTDPVGAWLPEIATPSVVRDPAGPIDDVVAAARPITVWHVLSSRTGWGFPSDFSYPAVQPLFEVLGQGPVPVSMSTGAWMAELGRIPLLHQPGESWLYNTSYDILGVLVERVSGMSLPDFLAERVFAPLAMRDTGFAVPPAQRDRVASLYRVDDAGALDLVEGPDGPWIEGLEFPSGAGGLMSTVDDWLAFGRLLLDGGSVGGRRVLSQDSVSLMTTDTLDAGAKEGELFLDGQGWGLGGSVDVRRLQPWNVPGRYGWVGGTGTAAHIVPSTGAVTILMTQVEMGGPTSLDTMEAFWSRTATDRVSEG